MINVCRTKEMKGMDMINVGSTKECRGGGYDQCMWKQGEGNMNNVGSTKECRSKVSGI